MIGALAALPPDPLLEIIGAFRDDPRPQKIDLGVGVYRNEHGATPVMFAVKEAETELIAEQLSKTYVGPEGDRDFVDLLSQLAFGPLAESVIGVQAVGGTGALRLGCDLLAAAGMRQMLLPTPSWANHPALIRASGLHLVEIPYFDLNQQKVAFEQMLHAITNAEHGSAILLQACCHNPLGADLSLAQWEALAGALAERKCTPFLDVAYQGFGDDIDLDMAGPRQILERLPEVLIAVSCAKNFGLYRDRVGALYVKSARASRSAISSNINAITRANYSMPPDHGAAVVRLILSQPRRAEKWRLELASMRRQIVRMRSLLAKAEVESAPMHAIGVQKGMFSSLPLSPLKITRLREKHAIYMTKTGRINVAGLHESQLDRFVDALREVSQS